MKKKLVYIAAVGACLSVAAWLLHVDTVTYGRGDPATSQRVLRAMETPSGFQDDVMQPEGGR